MRKGLRAMIIDSFHHCQRRVCLGESGRGCPVQCDVVGEFAKLELPRLVAARVLPRGRLGWSHLREHAVEREALRAVTAAEAVDLQLSGTAIDLEREEVLPFGAAD